MAISCFVFYGPTQNQYGTVFSNVPIDEVLWFVSFFNLRVVMISKYICSWNAFSCTERTLKYENEITVLARNRSHETVKKASDN